jgi:hypothetical protein
MIQITPHMRILVAVEPVDFRKGIDGLAALCRQVLSSDPLGGTLFVFCSRRRHAIKCLTKLVPQPWWPWNYPKSGMTSDTS